MSSAARLPVTWQDYADLWAHDPAHQREYAIIKPTLDALGITPGGSGDGNPDTYPVNTPKSLYHVDTIGGNDPPPTTVPGTNSDLGPGLPPQAEPYKSMIEEASRRTGVPASLLAGLIHDESRWQTGASSTNANGGGDTGLVQMNDNTFAALQAKHPELQGRNKNDPATNILAGAYYLADMKSLMKEKYGVDSWEIALRAYNSGENGVDPHNLSNLPAGTGDPNYVTKVMNYWHIIDSGGQLPA
ncbi:soluble lytic murein transglycosylase-like protein [Herbaspirillum sp. CF444]|uniref:lytic transglycosylase domain-containing protein n=1 Tax=Herbaspirillum sp. CF444 TaxID=1144319 RepID=UPI00027268C6|nr:transglycosylase SLT domain-containing protein [Herbaspirillum sp. CF444]EJL88983.1 soluble lytic murein transglycosylase-like protein [Herbaspirillum sp. CF444]